MFSKLYNFDQDLEVMQPIVSSVFVVYQDINSLAKMTKATSCDDVFSESDVHNLSMCNPTKKTSHFLFLFSIKMDIQSFCIGYKVEPPKY